MNAAPSLAEALRAPGRHAVTFIDAAGNADRPFTLNCYVPVGHTPEDRVVFVQHGMLRNGDEYRDFWIAAADRHRLLIVAPTFPNEHYPEAESYNNGLVIGEDGAVRPRNRWAYAALPRILDDLRQSGVTNARRVHLFGHSAGGQFAHRLLSLEPHDMLGAVIAANSGWYTLPTLERRFPEGIGGLGFDESRLATIFAYPLVVLAGEEDNATSDPHLPKQDEALRQGPHRFARAHNYVEFGRREAERLRVPFAWRLVPVPHIGHDGRAMSAVAASLWFTGELPDWNALAALAGERTA